MLTNASVKAAAPRDRAYKLWDGGGLHLLVAPTGRKSWRLKFRFGGREQLLTFGRSPAISLADARARRDRAREQLRAGVNPAASADTSTDIDQDFAAIARAWHSARAPHWSDKHAADVLASLETHAFPAIGARAIDAIDPGDVLELLQSAEQLGRIETARRLRQRISAIFRFAMRRKLCTADPAAHAGDELQPRPPAEHHPALLELDQVRALLETCERTPAAPVVLAASRFLSLTGVRLAALLGMTWGELEGLDGDAPMWRVPAERMKLSKAKKAQPRFSHVIPLSRQAAEEIRARARQNGYDTHSPPADDRIWPIGEAAIGALYARAGYQGRHVPHGWRSSFSTIANDLWPAERSLIDQALAHTPKDKVEAAYNRAEHMARRRDLFQRWADLLLPRLDVVQRLEHHAEQPQSCRA